MELEEINIGVDKNSVDSRPLLDKHDPALQVKVSWSNLVTYCQVT